MPVVGLPTTLEVTLDALLRENHLTSWKVTGESDNVVVVLRLKTGPANTNMACQHTPVAPCYYRKKAPSELQRDRRRAEERRNRAVRHEDCKESESFDSSAKDSPCLFVSTPPTSHTALHPDTSPNNTSPHETAREIRRAQDVTVTVLDSTMRVDQQSDIDLPAPTTTNDDCEGPLEKLHEAGCSASVIKEYVAELTDRSLQRKLRDTRRNRDFCTVYTCDDDPDTVICDSEDVVFQFKWTDDSDTPTDFFWFAKGDSKHVTQEERSICSKLLLWTPTDRGRMKDRMDTALEVMCVVMDGVRFFLG
ncbi:hypothetical protein ACOMHN_015623 [Nucella lapillus]